VPSLKGGQLAVANTTVSNPLDRIPILRNPRKSWGFSFF